MECPQWCQACHQVQEPFNLRLSMYIRETFFFSVVHNYFITVVKWFDDCGITGIPPPMGHHPGIPHMAQAPPTTTRPAMPATTVSTPQPSVSKPLFPSAGQVCCPSLLVAEPKGILSKIKCLYFFWCHFQGLIWLIPRKILYGQFLVRKRDQDY